MRLLFGTGPEGPIASVSYADVVLRVREEAERRQIGLDAFGDEVGWALEPLANDPNAVGGLNLVGFYEVCRAVGLDWLGVLTWAEQRGRRTIG